MIKIIKKNILNISYVSLSHVFMMVSLVGIQVSMTRILGPEQYGKFLLSQALIIVFEGTLISRAGEVAIYVIGRSWHDSNERKNIWGYITHLRWNEFGWNFSSWIIVFFLILLFSEKFKADIVCCCILSLAIPLQTTYGVSKGILVASGQIRAQTSLEMIYSAVSLVLIPLLTFFYGIIGSSVGFALMSSMKTILAHYTCRKILKDEELKKGSLRPKLLGLSIQSFLRTSLKNLVTQSDVLILGLFSTTSTVSLYKIGRTLANISMRAADPIWSVARPKILSYISTDNKKQLINILIKLAFILLIFGYLLLLPILYLYGKNLISIFYGEIYLESYDIFVILFIGSWMYSGVTGWLNFTMVINKNKHIGIYFLVALNIFMVLACYLSKGRLEYQSLSISAMYIIFSIVAWVILLSRRVI
jgi:O-antigen/teichoic acid export membrane protein